MPSSGPAPNEGGETIKMIMVNIKLVKILFYILILRPNTTSTTSLRILA